MTSIISQFIEDFEYSINYVMEKEEERIRETGAIFTKEDREDFQRNLIRECIARIMGDI